MGGGFVVDEEVVVTRRLVAVVLEGLVVVVEERARTIVVVRAGREVFPGAAVVDGMIADPVVIVKRPSARLPGEPVMRTRYSPGGFATVAR